jgi:hypothetical protein
MKVRTSPGPERGAVTADVRAWLRERLGRRPDATVPHRRPNEDIAAMLRAFKASSVVRPPD